jgi:hypothetical protein
VSDSNPNRRRWLRRNLIILTPIIICALSLLSLVLYGKHKMESTPLGRGQQHADFDGLAFQWTGRQDGLPRHGLAIRYKLWFSDVPHNYIYAVFDVFPSWKCYATSRWYRYE